jgi:hypothetical protein
VVLWGTLSEIGLETSPTVETTTGSTPWRWASDSCDVVDPALILSIAVDRMVPSQVPIEGKITISIGSQQRARFDPMPVRGADGSVAWVKTAKTRGNALKAGQRIGLAAHYVSEFDRWSLMGDSLFAENDLGSLVAQVRLGSCVDSGIAGIDGKTPSELFDLLKQCPPMNSASASRRAVLRATLGPGQDPSLFFAAQCFRRESAWEPGSCRIQSDCEGAKQCVEARCR